MEKKGKINKENYGVIEQEHIHVDYDGNGDYKLIIENNYEQKEKIYKKKDTNRCKFIKQNGKQCKQSGKINQSGGPIINGYCKYHTKLEGK